MVNFYVNSIKMGQTNIDDVPERWREAVREKIENEA